MRTDIKMDINLGELDIESFPPINATSVIWISEDDYYIYGEAIIEFPITIDIARSGIGLIIHQQDTIKEIKINFKYTDSFGEESETGYLVVENDLANAVRGCDLPLITDKYYEINDRIRREIIDRTDTFFLRFGYWDTAGEWVYSGYWIYDANATSLVLPDEDYFLVRSYLTDDDSIIKIYDGYENDLSIVRAIDQNEFFLLIASPGSIAHNPITGVGIVSYLNSDIMSSGLSEKILEEFDLDGMIVQSATLDEETGQIEMMAIEKSN